MSINKDSFGPNLNDKQMQLGKKLDEHFDRVTIKPIHPSSSKIYYSALYLLQKSDINNPDWISQAAHSLRELMYPMQLEAGKGANGNGKKIIKYFKKNGKDQIEYEVKEWYEIYNILNDLAHHGVDRKQRKMTEEEIKNYKRSDLTKLVNRFENMFLFVLSDMVELFQNVDKLIERIDLDDNNDINKSQLIKLLRDDRIVNYFYFKIDHRWVNWLLSNSFFDELYSTQELTNRKYIMLQYLYKVVTIESKNVAKIINNIIINENTDENILYHLVNIIHLLENKDLSNIIDKVLKEHWVIKLGNENALSYYYNDIQSKLLETGNYEGYTQLLLELTKVADGKNE